MHQVECLGWVANQIDPNMSVYYENVQTLEKMMGLASLQSLVIQAHFVSSPELYWHLPCG